MFHNVLGTHGTYEEQRSANKGKRRKKQKGKRMVAKHLAAARHFATIRCIRKDWAWGNSMGYSIETCATPIT